MRRSSLAILPESLKAMMTKMKRRTMRKPLRVTTKSRG